MITLLGIVAERMIARSLFVDEALKPAEIEKIFETDG